MKSNDVFKIKIITDFTKDCEQKVLTGYFNRNIKPRLKKSFGNAFAYEFEEEPCFSFIIVVPIDSKITKEFIEETAKDIKVKHKRITCCITSKM